MTRSILRPATLAAIVLTVTVAPAFAISIRHTSRVEGDPDAAAAPRAASHAAPPSDTSGVHYFDKLHESGTRG